VRDSINHGKVLVMQRAAATGQAVLEPPGSLSEALQSIWKCSLCTFTVHIVNTRFDNNEYYIFGSKAKAKDNRHLFVLDHNHQHQIPGQLDKLFCCAEHRAFASLLYNADVCFVDTSAFKGGVPRHFRGGASERFRRIIVDARYEFPAVRPKPPSRSLQKGVSRSR
jgi:hypothetical protein